FGHVAHGLPYLGLGALPRGAAEPIDRRLRRARVLLDQIEALYRNEQLVLTGVLQLEEFLHRARAGADRNLFQPDEHPDTMIHVHDEVPDLEIAEVGEEGLRERTPALGRAALLLEEIGLRVDLQQRVGQPEATRQQTDPHQHGRVARYFGALD